MDSQARKIQCLFRKFVSTAQLCRHFMDSEFSSRCLKNHQPQMSFTLFLNQAPYVLMEFRALFYRINKFLKQFQMEHSGGLCIEGLFSFQEWVIVYIMIYYRSEACDFSSPTLNNVCLRCVNLIEDFHCILHELVRVKCWSKVPLEFKRGFYNSVVGLNSALDKNRATLHHLCADSIYEDAMISKKSIDQCKRSLGSECTCKTIEDWLNEVIHSRCIFIDKEEFTPAVVEPVSMDPRRLSLLEKVPFMWIHYPLSVDKEMVMDALLPPLWKRRIFTFTQILYEAVLHHKLTVDDEGVSFDHLHAMAQHQFGSLFPLRNANDERDFKSCLVFLQFGNPECLMAMSYERYMGGFFNEFILHFMYISEHEGIEGCDVELFLNLSQERSNLDALFTFFSEVQYFLRIYSASYQDCRNLIESVSRWEELQNEFAVLGRSREDLMRKIEIIASLFVSLFNTLVFIRMHTFEDFFFKKGLHCHNFPALSPYAMKQLTTWNKILYDKIDLKNTAIFIKKVIEKYAFSSNRTPQHIFITCMMELCLSSNPTGYPEMFLLEWPRISHLSHQLNNLASFLVIHKIAELFGFDRDKSVKCYLFYRKKYLLSDNKKFVFLDKNDLSEFFSPEEASVLYAHMPFVAKKDTGSSFYSQCWRKIAILTLSKDTTFLHSKSGPLLDTSGDFFRLFETEHPDYEAAFESFHHLKGDICTIHKIFLKMVETSWKLKENRFSKIVRQLLEIK